MEVKDVSGSYLATKDSPCLPGYKLTEVGVIPEDWKVFKLSDSAKVTDSLHQTPSFTEDGYSMVRVADIKTGNLYLDGTLKVSEKIFKEFTKSYLPQRGNIVLSRVGSYGVSSFMETNEPFCLGQNTVIIQPNLPARFLYYVLNSLSIKLQIEDGSYGSGYKSLSLRNINELLITVPPTKAEQEAIAEALSDADALIESLEQLLAKKRQIKQGAMQELLTGQKRLPGFSGEWELKLLGDIAEIVMGQSPSSSNYNSKGLGLPLIQGNADILNRKTIRRIFTTQITKLGKRDDILISVRAPVGEISRAMFDVCLGRGVCAIRSRSDFLYYYLINLEQSWAKLSKGSTFDSVNSIDVKDLNIRLPTDSKEQTAIATILSDMVAEISALQTKLTKARQIKQGMMQELLTGRIRLLLRHDEV